MDNGFLTTIENLLTETLIKKAAQLPKNFQQTKFIQNCVAALEDIEDIEEGLDLEKGGYCGCKYK